MKNKKFSVTFVILMLFTVISFSRGNFASAIEHEEIPEYIIINGEQYSTELTALLLASADITNADIEQLKYMTNLEYLSIINSSTFTGMTRSLSNVSALAGLKNLKYLEMVSAISLLKTLIK